ncbi:MAG: BREX system ATP-binding domain-containing protein [Janthinobacterium lividum]
MSEPNVTPSQWGDVIRREYLADYLRGGGSAVKVLSGSGKSLQAAWTQVAEDARASGYFVAALDPATLDPAGKKRDLHRIDKFFFAVTENVPWKAWAAEQARRYLADHGIRAEGRALDDLDGIAADNGRDAVDLLNQYQREFATPLLKDPTMSLEFRTALKALGLAQLVPQSFSPTSEEVLLAWLGGRTLPGASTALKKMQIYERITQANARPMLASFCRWLPKVGFAGLVVSLDFRPYEHKKIPKTQREAQINRLVREALAAGASTDELAAIVGSGDADPEITYSDAAYMQMLTLIRRFIDEVDWFERFLLVIQTTPRFYDSLSRRNYFNYDALQTRIGLEVHDLQKSNPAAALVHLGTDETGE